MWSDVSARLAENKRGTDLVRQCISNQTLSESPVRIPPACDPPTLPFHRLPHTDRGRGGTSTQEGASRRLLSNQEGPQEDGPLAVDVCARADNIAKRERENERAGGEGRESSSIREKVQVGL